jgi:hypothetical protein
VTGVTTPINYYHARGSAVYHSDPSCPAGRQIPTELMVDGSGGLLWCRTCRARSEAKPPSGPFVAPAAPEVSHEKDGTRIRRED